MKRTIRYVFLTTVLINISCFSIERDQDSTRLPWPEALEEFLENKTDEQYYTPRIFYLSDKIESSLVFIIYCAQVIRQKLIPRL